MTQTFKHQYNIYIFILYLYTHFKQMFNNTFHVNTVDTSKWMKSGDADAQNHISCQNK